MREREHADRLLNYDPTLESRVETIPLGLPSTWATQVSPTSRPLPIRASKRFLLFVGARGAYKDFELLLGAMRRLGPGAPELIVASEKPVSIREKRLIGELGLYRQIQRVVVDDLGLRDLYAQALALVYPSRYEGFGIPLLEAMSTGCLVVTLSSCSLPEVAGACGITLIQGL